MLIGAYEKNAIVNHGSRISEDPFIYALSADETSLVIAAPRHAITALLSCCFKCACPPGGNLIFAATPTERITHYTLQAKSCAKGDTLFGNPYFVGKLV
nr:MAG TPA: Complement C5-like protein [Caudoviricetes sp.]